MSAHVARVLRERRERERHFIVVRKPSFDDNNSDIEDTVFDQMDNGEPLTLCGSCYLPRAKCPWLCCAVGLLLISLGAVQCYFAFHWKQYVDILDGGDEENHVLEKLLKSFAYIGPTVVGTGAFIITVSCVIVFESHDRIVRAMRNREVERTSRNKEFIYNAVMKRFVNEAACKSAAAKAGRFEPGDFDAAPATAAAAGAAATAVPATAVGSMSTPSPAAADSSRVETASQAGKGGSGVATGTAICSTGRGCGRSTAFGAADGELSPVGCTVSSSLSVAQCPSGTVEAQV